jgi:hypothetical protein
LEVHGWGGRLPYNGGGGPHCPRLCSLNDRLAASFFGEEALVLELDLAVFAGLSALFAGCRESLRFHFTPRTTGTKRPVRFEPTVLRLSLFLQLQQVVQAAMEGALLSGLIPQVERELLVIDGEEHSFVLEPQSALGEPVVFGHVPDQEGFGGGFRLVFGGEGFDEDLELVVILVGKEGELARKSVASVIAGRRRFAFFGARPC